MYKHHPFRICFYMLIYFGLFVGNALALKCENGIYVEGSGTLHGINNSSSTPGLVYITNPQLAKCETKGTFKKHNPDPCSKLDFKTKYSGFVIDQSSIRNKQLISETLANQNNRVTFKACSDKVVNGSLSIDKSCHGSWVEMDGTVIGYTN